MGQRVPLLDWLRFLAAVVVVIDHAREFAFVSYAELTTKGPIVAAFMFIGRAGYEAVIVFFVLSGFLVGGTALQRAVNGTFDWKTYTVDRVGRIMTPLIPAICLTVFVSYLVAGQFQPIAALGNALSLQGILVPVLGPNGPLWSLSYEVWFYVLGGAVAALIAKRHWLPVVLVAVSLAVYLRLDPTYLLIWLLGAACSFYRPKRHVQPQLALAVVVSGLGLVLSELTRESKAFASLPVSHDASIAIMSLGIALLICCLREVRTSEAVARCGAMAAAPSYTLYLCHAPLMALVLTTKPGQITPASIGVFLALLWVAFAGSTVLYWLFERNTRSVKRWLTARPKSAGQRRSGTAQTVPPYPPRP